MHHPHFLSSLNLSDKSVHCDFLLPGCGTRLAVFHRGQMLLVAPCVPLGTSCDCCPLAHTPEVSASKLSLQRHLLGDGGRQMVMADSYGT